MPLLHPAGTADLQHVAGEILALGEHLEAAVDVSRIDHQLVKPDLAGIERNLLEQLLHHRVQTSRTDVLCFLVHLEGDFGQSTDAILDEIELDALGPQQGLVLARETGIGTGHDA